MSRLLNLTLALVLALGLAACDSSEPDPPPPPPPPPATTGTISGSISLPPGTNGSVQNTRMALYTSVEDYNADRFAYQVGANGDGSYTVANIVPGVYYVEAWKDNDNSQTITIGDFYGVYGSLSGSGVNLTPVPVAAGSSTTISFAITQINGAFAPKRIRAAN